MALTNIFYEVGALYKRNCHNDWQFVTSYSDEWTKFITM